MPASRPGMPDRAVLRKWFAELQESDPKVHAELETRLQVGGEESLESVGGGMSEDDFDLALETIVLREGRPVLPIRGNRISDAHKADEESREIVKRLVSFSAAVEPAIPLVGRIDVANHAGGLEFVGTGWLLEENLVVTNRHVAELIARRDGAKYSFRPGRFGDPLQVSIDYLREPDSIAQASVAVESVEWIVPEATGPDLALLKVARRTDGNFAKKIDLASNDASVDDDVVVIGYPARAPAHIIRDQALMDQIYGGVYDVKRIAPGKMKGPSRGWATHDCTTLGGNSGSVVLDMKSGRAVALHFAGLYLIENYCVPASKVRYYLEPNNRKPVEIESAPKPKPVPKPVPAPQSPVVASTGEITITIPLTIKVSLGHPFEQRGSAGPKAMRVEDAARALGGELGGDGVYAVRPGYVVEGGRLTDQECVVVKADPTRIQEIRGRVPATYGSLPVEVRPASVLEMSGEEDVATEAAIAISYNDDDRTGPGFSFDWVEEEMTVKLCVGPEQSWPVLSDFLGRTQRELVSSIYEFHAKHVADALDEAMGAGSTLTLVMAPQTKGTKKNEEEFDRLPTFEKWAAKYKSRFDRIFVPIGTGGLVARSYHIKVTVQDEKNVWLSSGNWKGASQPNIAEADRENPKRMKGNREWHVVLRNKTLANRFRNHILEDRKQSEALGGTLETPFEAVLIDVPIPLLESIELEGAPERLLPPLEFTRKVRLKPLLTPDDEGGVYSRAVLELIRSAKEQLLFQNQYISVTSNSGGFFGDLVDALVERSNEIEDVRVILRSGGSDFLDQVSELKRRGMDVNRCVRRMANTHTKGIVVDGRRVLVGSHNWSSLGVTLNRDASLIFDDRQAAEYFRDAFEIDWNRASELAIEDESVFTEAPRLAVGDEPPAGFRRMSLASYLEG